MNSIHERYFRLWLDKYNKNKVNDFASIEETLSHSSININQPLNKEKFYFLFFSGNGLKGSVSMYVMDKEFMIILI